MKKNLNISAPYQYRRRRHESEKQLFRKLNLSSRELEAAIKESAERWKI